MSSDDVVTTIARVAQQSWGAVLALLTSRLGDIQFAEDMLQESIVTALSTWEAKGIPENPEGWLFRVAMNRAIDQARRNQRIDIQQAQLTYFAELAEQPRVPEMVDAIPDERLRMIFTCCHPSIEQRAQIALTLRTLCGLSTSEIARAFLQLESTMAQRLVRAKRKIRDAGIPYEVPQAEVLPSRLDSVLGVLYLIFNEGYSSSDSQELIRGDLCDEAIYLSTELCALLPQQAEVLGLCALMLLHDSRRAARVDASGQLVVLAEQDRRLWNRQQIQRGMQLLSNASVLQQTGPYQLQAAISAAHAIALKPAQTNWSGIVDMYAELYKHTPTMVVALNQAVAVSFASDPQQGLTMLMSISQRSGWSEKLSRYLPYHVALADMHSRLGNTSSAIDAFRCAIEYSSSAQEKSYLSRKLTDLLNTQDVK